MTAWNRWLIDLIADDQIRCIPTSSTTTLLTPVEVNGGVKGAVIPLSPTEAIVIEPENQNLFIKVHDMQLVMFTGTMLLVLLTATVMFDRLPFIVVTLFRVST